MRTVVYIRLPARKSGLLAMARGDAVLTARQA